ncbi:MAG: hypothetical protein IKW30_13105 [Lachnospiraceae bacterium]|nr:hypothetical protein [Lachnospiraceae bacterium]
MKNSINKKEESISGIGVKSFVTAILVIFIMMILTYLLTLMVPGSVAGTYEECVPLVVPIAQAFDISAQLCIVAFAFGDGFSNVFYPTNPVLLISLGLVNVSYGDWVKWSAKFQIVNILLTSLLLLVGLAIGYS